MDFRILGPLEVNQAGRQLALEGRQQRALLALLLLHANEVVPVDTIIDELWPETPPPSATRSVHALVSRLRRLLEDEPSTRNGGEGDSGVLLTRSHGYLLRVAPGELDLDRFESLLGRGRNALAAGQADMAAKTLREALAIWRGPPLAEFAFDSFAIVEIARLNELRLSALEERIDADLAAGRSAELVAELAALVATHPLRERLRRQLMLALYRSGRQAEALEAYRDARAALGELGIEPGEYLRRVEKQILMQDPALGLPERRTNLPIQPAALIGRTRELAELRELIDLNRLVTLTGAGGSGKTRLALEAAAGLVDEFRDGVWFVSLASLTDPGLVEATIAQSLGARGSLSDFLRGKSMLLLLDNLEQLLPGVAPTVARLEGKVLATSRERLNVLAEQEYPLPPLALDDAVALFVQRARRLQPRFEVDEDVPEIARRLDRLPLALELAAARVKVLTPRQILERLGHSLDLLAGGATDRPERQRTLRATIEWSYDLLTPEEQRLFARLAVFVGGCMVEAAAQVADANVDMLQSLVDKSLIHHTQSRYWMLETVREYARERLDEAERNELYRRLAKYLLAFVRPEMTPAERTRQASATQEELDNLRGCIASLRQSRDTTLVLRLAARASFFNATAREQIRWLDDALRETNGVPERLRLDALAARAWVAWASGDFDATAHFGQRALEGYRRLGARAEESDILRALGNAADAVGNFDHARTLLEHALEAAELAGDRVQSNWALHSLAELELHLGNLDAAAPLFARSAEQAEETGDRPLLTYIFHGMGDVALAQNDFTEAAASYRRSVRLSIELGQRRTPPSCVAGLAVVAASIGDTKQAGELWGAVSTLERELGFPLLPYERARYDRFIRAHADAHRAAFAAAVERGTGMSVNDIYEEALAGR